MSPHACTEDQLIEQPAIALFAELGWQTLSAMEEVLGTSGTLGRETSGEVVLIPRLRAALPQALFLAFTGTPLIVGEERTKEVFGDYVSIYDFQQSIEDGATVPLYYENRTPELQLVKLLDHLPRQADEKPHAHADHRARQPRVPVGRTISRSSCCIAEPILATAS